jgi:ribosome-binding factor A
VTSRRPQRVAEQIRDDLARLLREELRDPDVGFVTLTDVELSSDLRHARVYVSVLGDETRALAALDRARSFLRHALAREGRLRFTPDLRFVVDRSTTTGFRVERLLTNDVEDGAAGGPDEEPG